VTAIRAKLAAIAAAARLVSSAATQQAPTTGPIPSSLRAACRAGFTCAKPAAISSAGPNSAAAAAAAEFGGQPAGQIEPVGLGQAVGQFLDDRGRQPGRQPGQVALLVVLGEAGLFGSPRLLAYAGAMAACFHLFVTGYEEPALRRRFGPGYLAYRRAVPRWIPRRPPCEAGTTGAGNPTRPAPPEPGSRGPDGRVTAG
jgi:hypothetical protein